MIQYPIIDWFLHGTLKQRQSPQSSNKIIIDKAINAIYNRQSHICSCGETYIGETIRNVEER